MSEDHDARLRFAVPPLPDDAASIAATLNWEDPDERSMLIRLAHPELDAALEEGLDQIEVNGEPMSIRLHLTMHQVVATQIVDQDPPLVWKTAQRLQRADFEHHEILHMLASTMVGQIWGAIVERESYDSVAHVNALLALPGEWGRPHSRRSTGGDGRRSTRKSQRAARRGNRRR